MYYEHVYSILECILHVLYDYVRRVKIPLYKDLQSQFLWCLEYSRGPRRVPGGFITLNYTLIYIMNMYILFRNDILNVLNLPSKPT